jgi:hypothetical protein
MGQLRIVDPGRRPSTDLRLGNGKGLYIGPSSSLAFNADRAFGVREDGRRIYVFDAANPSSPVSGSFAVAHAHQVYLSGDTLVVVGRTGGGVRRVTAQFDHVGGIGSPLPSAPDTITIRGVPVGNAPGGLWCWLGDRLVRENVTGDQLGAAIPLFAEPVMALSAPDGGLFVEAVPQATVAGRSTRLFYYSPSAVASGASSPTVINRQPVDDLSLDPAGGVIVGHRPFAGGEKIYRWNPAAAS